MGATYCDIIDPAGRTTSNYERGTACIKIVFPDEPKLPLALGALDFGNPTFFY
jgi:hypothetical protein